MLKGEFLEKVKYIHGDKYDYILNNDFKISDYIRIICPVHGEFKQRCYAHLRGQNCPKCINNKKLTTEEWINKAKSIHGDKYDYSKVNYVNKRTPIIIISKEFGEFEQLPNVHLKGSGLPKQINNINGIIDYDIEKTLKFIEKSKKIHGYRYDYSKVEYVNCKTKVCIICPIHGEFWQTPNNHLNGRGCNKCKVNNNKLTTLDFINKAKEVHGDKYDYSKVEYVNNDIKVCIICPIHGEFWQLPNAHLQGHGCCKCANNKKLTTEEFIEKAKEVHGDKYDYSKVEYINNKTKVIITCPIHGEFLQLPNAHLQGHGCDKCNESHLEKEIVNNLINNKIEYIREYKFANLKRKEFDFYLPKYNIVIECQGEQHFNKKHFFDKKDSYNNRIKRDVDKYEFCKKNCIELLYYKNSKQIICEELYFYTKDNTFDNVNDLIEYIKKS